MKIRNIILASAVTAVGLMLSGCVTTEVTQVDPKANNVVNSSQISPGEWSEAADKLVSDLFTSGVLERAPQKPAIMAVSRIVNNTQQQVDTDSLVKKIRVALNQSGKVLTTTTLGLGGKSEDPLAKEAAEYNQFMNGQKQQSAMPFFTLSGKLLEDRIRNGADTQITYTFQLSLTQVDNGLAVWESEKQLAKIARKPSVSW